MFKEFINEMTILQFTIYALISLTSLHRAYRHNGLSFFSRTNQLLVNLRNSIIFIFLTLLLFIVVKMSFIEDLGDYLSASFLSFIIYYHSFTIIKRSFSESDRAEQSKTKYLKSSLSKEKKDQILHKLEIYMNSDKPYQNSSVSLSLMAKQLAVSPHHLSQTINNCLHKNFYKYLSDYRIKDAKYMLSQSDFTHLTIEEIAIQVGYNSKSAFNNAFKKLTGMTPSHYRENNTVHQSTSR
jgi:AraC-like DNA-binding protein